MDEKQMDEKFEQVCKIVKEEEEKPHISVPKKEKLVIDTWKSINKAVRGDNLKITQDLHKPFKTVGSVTINGKSIDVIDTNLFAQMISLANDIDVWPKTDGTVDIDIGFIGLAEVAE